MHLSFVQHLEAGTVVLEKDESLHVSKVLRLKSGDSIKLTDGKGNSAVGIISASSKKNITVKVAEIENEKNCPYLLELAVAPTKSNDRFEWILEKCTEVGIRKIHPILCHHSERRKVNLERCQKILLSAMKQSQKNWLPEITEPKKFSTFINDIEIESKLISHCETDFERTSLKVCIKNSPTLICIGPEGDFSPEEIKQALDNGFQSVHLGEERLRTETAAIFSSAVFQSQTRL